MGSDVNVKILFKEVSKNILPSYSMIKLMETQVFNIKTKTLRSHIRVSGFDSLLWLLTSAALW